MDALAISQEMRQQVMDLLNNMKNGDIEGEGSIDNQRRYLLASIVALRAANRNAWLSSRTAKSRTNDTKQGIDRMNLELQGLFYEQRHLRTEIQICKATPTIYDSIPLIEEDQFLEAHQDARELSPQDLMRARLQHEKEERLRLESVRSELTAKKAALVSENKKRKHDLEALEKQLNTFIGSAENISSIFQKY